MLRSGKREYEEVDCPLDQRLISSQVNDQLRLWRGTPVRPLKSPTGICASVRKIKSTKTFNNPR